MSLECNVLYWKSFQMLCNNISKTFPCLSELFFLFAATICHPMQNYYALNYHRHRHRHHYHHNTISQHSLYLMTSHKIKLFIHYYHLAIHIIIHTRLPITIHNHIPIIIVEMSIPNNSLRFTHFIFQCPYYVVYTFARSFESMFEYIFLK